MSDNDHKKIIESIIESAIELRNHILTAIFPSITEEDHAAALEAAEGGLQGADPRQVLTKMVWDRLGEQGLIPPGWEHVAGYCGKDSHTWFQRTHIHTADLDDGTTIMCDPLPLRWIVDPAPIELLEPVIAMGPNSPFQLLYKAAGNTGSNNADKVGDKKGER